MSNNSLIVSLVNNGEYLPVKGTPQSAAYDLFATKDVDIIANSPLPAQIPTGVAIKFPTGYYGQIACRSGLAANKGASVEAGVIDSDYYPGEIKVLLRATTDFKIKKGERCAQILIKKIFDGETSVVDAPNTTTTHAGFGSTGV